jgi:alcohol dehydrogenase (NADP+)
MHWPVSSTPSNHEEYISVPSSIPYFIEPDTDTSQTWASMLTLPESKVRHVGICNFSPAQLKTLITLTGVKPYAHQMELHPYLQQSSWIKLHKRLGISVTAYSPLGNSNPTYHDGKEKDYPPALLDNKVLVKIGEKRNCTAAQVALAWGMSRGTSVIPKSKHEEYIQENFNAAECTLKKSDLKNIEKVGDKWLTRFNNPSEAWEVNLFEGLDGV